jgi:hypothetical protein
MQSVPTLVEFLKHVLPSEGYYCWVALKKGQHPQQGFSQTVGDLAEVLKRLDALGFDAYFSCSTYKDPVNRKRENAKTTQALWLDIDAGEGKPYVDVDAATEALDQFCARVNMPQPTIVYSGGGIHAWWALSAPLQPEAWLVIARQFKQLTEAHGLHADPTRTADICSILRPPETFNWKLPGNPRAVECLEIIGDKIQLPNIEASKPQIAVNPHAGDMSLSIGKAAGNIYENREPAYASIAANKCLQLRNFRDTRGNIAEPLWYAGLGILGQCADGYELAHEWSAGHPSYSREETDRKFAQAKNASSATTCERYKFLNAPGCLGCPFSITSPIVLGRERKEIAAVVQQASAETFPPLPKGYGMNPGYQLTYEIKRVDDKGVEQRSQKPFTRYPIYVHEVRDGETERKQGILFRQWEPAKGWYEFELSAQNLASMGTWGELAAHGAVMLDPDSRKIFLKYVSVSLDSMRGKGAKMRFDQFGWKDNYTSFYYGGQLWKTDGTVDVAAGNTECANRSKKMLPARAGSLNGWRAAVSKLFVDGCEAQSLAVLASFAAVLMPFVSQPGEGGVILSLFSPDGGTGKSTTLAAISSVWGELSAIRLQGSDTQNAKFRIIATHGNLPTVYDELRERHPEILVDFVKHYTTGQDKNRARIDGSVNPNTLPWCNIVVSASNKSLVDGVNSATKIGTDPMADRIFEVQLQIPKQGSFSLSGALGDELMLHRGYAGRAFISYLMQPGVLAYCRENLVRLMEHYPKAIAAGTTDRYRSRLLATCDMAGRILKHIGLVEFSPERVMDWAVREAATQARNTQHFDPIDALIDVLNSSVVNNCLIVDDAYRPKSETFIHQEPRSEIQMRYEIKPKRLFISANWLRNKLAEMGQPYQLCSNMLSTMGILIDKSRRTVLTAGTSKPGGKTPCWEVDMSHAAMGQVYVKEVLPLQAKTG